MKKFPKIIRYTRPHKIKTIKGRKGLNLSRFSVALRLKSTKYMTYSHFESARMSITKRVKPKELKNKKNLKLIKSARKKHLRSRRRKRTKQKKFLFIRSNLCSPLTKKPLQVRMGKGKGLVDHWIHVGRISRVIFEMSRQRLKLRKIFRLFRLSSNKLPIKTKFFYSRYYARRETNFAYHNINKNNKIL